MSEAWRLDQAVSLRSEAFGGMAFHRRRGVTMEVDGEAYRFLRSCLDPRPLPRPDDPGARLVPQLVRLGFLCPVRGGASPPAGAPVSPALDQEPPSPRGDGFTLSAPEVVHVAITARCNRACPGCYVPRRGGGPELTVAEWRGLIDGWASMRVFQLAVGGGEPLLYQGLFELLRYARERGIVPNLTTNGDLLGARAVGALERAGVARVNVSWNGPTDDPAEANPSAIRALQACRDSSLQVGVNVLVTPSLLADLPGLLARLQRLGARHVTILRPKPPAGVTEAGVKWYATNRLERAHLLRLRQILSAWGGVLRVEVDSALAGLMGDAGPASLRWRGVHGCTAGRRICTAWPDGRVTPCSFLADLPTGNVRRTPFEELWAHPGGWEGLRDPNAGLGGGCADCAAASQCGGACCVARYEGGHGLLSGDGECPAGVRAGA